MGLFRIFGWAMLLSGIGMIASPLLSSVTGFAIASLNIGLPEPHLSFSLTTFVVGGLLALVGLFIVNPRKKSVIGNM